MSHLVDQQAIHFHPWTSVNDRGKVKFPLELLQPADGYLPLPGCCLPFELFPFGDIPADQICDEQETGCSACARHLFPHSN